MFDYEAFMQKIEVCLGLTSKEGIELGIYDAQDMLDMQAGVERRHAARIFHSILHKKYDVKDLSDISEASRLLDLYDCRVCVNHIAQVYLRDIMKMRLENIFDGRAYITEAETVQALSRISQIAGN